MSDKRDSGPGGLKATPGDDPAPLGHDPSSERIVDAASELSFPASDPPALDAAAQAAEEETQPSIDELNRSLAAAPVRGAGNDPFPFPTSSRH